MANRLKRIMPIVMALTHCGFIRGRSRSNNVIIAQEIIHFMQKTWAKKGVLAFKIDMDKAYDHVNWNILKATLQDFSFPSMIVRLVMC